MGDAALNAVAVAAAGDAAGDLVVDSDRFAAKRDRIRVLEQQGPQTPRDPIRLRFDERLLTDEIGPLVESNREAEAGLIGIVLGRDVAAPDAIPLFQAHGVD